MKRLGLAVLLLLAGWLGLTMAAHRLQSRGFRDAVVAAIERRSGRQASLQRLHLRLLPWPQLRADGLRVGDVLQVGHLSADIAVWPLFDHVVRLDRLALDQVTLDLVRDASGRANWQKPAKPASGRPGAGGNGGSSWVVRVEGMRVEGAELSWRDALLRRRGHMSLTRLAASGLQGARPRLDLEGVAGGAVYQVQGTVGPLTRLLDDDDRRTAWPMSLQARETVAGVVVGRGQASGAVGDPLHGHGYDLALSATMSRLDALNRLFPHAALPAARDIDAAAHLLDPGSQGGAWLSTLRVKAGATRFADLLLQSWSIDASRPSSPVAVTAAGSWSGQKLTMDGTVASLGEIAQMLPRRRMRVMDADLRVRAPPGQGAIDARLLADGRASPATVSLSMHPVTLPAAALAPLLGLPTGLRGEVELVGQLAASGESVVALRDSLSGHLGLSMVDGAVSNQVLSRLLGRGAVFSAMLGKTGETSLRCLAAHAGLGGGSAMVDSLSAEAGPISLSGHGRVGLANGGLDLHLLADASLGAASASLPVTLQGSVRNPVVALEAAAPKGRYVLTIGPGRGPNGAATDCATALLAAREGMAGPQPARPGKRKAPKPIDILRRLGLLH